jgi:hypothetical protein
MDLSALARTNEKETMRIMNANFAELTVCTTVALLPAASTANKGWRMMVSDALTPTFGATVAGTGAVTMPVFSDGTAWKVG